MPKEFVLSLDENSVRFTPNGEIAMGVKMLSTYGKTKRPRGALLQLGIGFEIILPSIGGRL